MHIDRYRVFSVCVCVFAVVFCAVVSAADNTPPKGLKLLFNGKDLTNWRTDGNAEKHWKIIDGALEYDGKGRSLVTEKKYGDFELWVDWKIPAGGDSGIYLRGKPQAQIWDTPKIGSGGLFNNKKNPSKPLVIADNPVGQWNTFKIRMVGDKVTIHLNGKLVVDNVTLENWPKYETPIPSKGCIELQHHGSKLWFKNIYIKELRKGKEGMTEAKGRTALHTRATRPAAATRPLNVRVDSLAARVGCGRRLGGT